MSFTSDFDFTPSMSPLLAASRFDSCFDAYGLSLKQHDSLEQRTVTLIARSPASPPAQALAMNLGRFQPLTIEVRIIFAQIAPPDALNLLLQSLEKACRTAPEDIIRWAKNRALLDAHERLMLGQTLCWTGDSMRRSEDSRSAIDRVDDCTPGILAEVNASFWALWRASKPLPKTLFCRSLVSIGSPPIGESYQANLARAASIVSLDEYLRIRRH
ncbi:MAG TPA: hypothetical protein VE986_03755 [Hyphomicrobiales bacterium]|nr:hypothetical protein [Hyphomicrobiales bacterium]